MEPEQPKPGKEVEIDTGDLDKEEINLDPDREIGGGEKEKEQ